MWGSLRESPEMLKYDILVIFNEPETDKMVQFLATETDKKCQFLGPEIVKMVQ